MALFKYDSTNDKLVPLTSEGSIGLPVGAVMAFAQGISSNENWLLCDGRDTTGTDEELQTKYPALYTYLGNSNVLPDYRECVLVGVGQNDTDTIAEHDVYTLGEFKDDQLQNITGTVGRLSSTYTGDASGAFYRDTGSENYSTQGGIGSYGSVKFDASRVARTGTTTHGKQKGVAFYIKATSAGIEVDKDLYATKGYIRDQNTLSDYENVTISRDSSNPTIMPYDGFLHVRYPGVAAGSGYARTVNINGIASGITAQAAAADQYVYVPPINFQKGDSVYLPGSSTPNRVMARYYKLRDYTGR